MKNIHVIQTDKPSRLVLETVNNNLFLTTTTEFPSKIMVFQNIYITSDEGIKAEDWVITPNPKKPLEKVTKKTYLPHYNKKRKIILTTDQDLIRDGVQAIDDEFLQWFVKNSSCEFFEVEHIGYVNAYNLIIPKEEHKQTIQEYEQQGLEKHSYDLESKQETLEEASNKIINETFQEVFSKHPKGGRLTNETIEEVLKIFFKLGAKWQAERMYSEEDMREAYKYGRIWDATSFEEWFEQFKKK